MIARVLFAVLIITAGVGPVAAKPDAATVARLTTSLLKTHVAPRYHALSNHMIGLQRSVSEFCQQPDQTRLLETQAAYKKALSAWMGVQHIRFGPVMQNDRIYRIQYWPDKHGQGAKHVRRIVNDQTRVAPPAAKLAKASVAVQGLPIMERLLFSKANAALFTKDANANRLCAHLRAVSDNLVAMSEAMSSQWRTYKQPDPQEGFQKLYHALVEQLLVIETLKIDRPLGKSLDKARGRRAENWRAERSLANIAENMKALSALFAGENGGFGLMAGMDADSEVADFFAAIKEHLDYGVAIAKRIEKPLHLAVSNADARKDVVFLKKHVRETRRLIRAYVAPELGVSVRFNSLDGD